MGTVVTILILTGAIAALIKVVSKRITWLERWSWHLSILVALGGIGIAVAQLLAEKKTQRIVQNAVKEEISPLVCKIDSLEMLIQLQAITPGIEELYRQLAREQAECLAATEVLRTAMDSGKMEIGLGDYDKAIIHLNYATLGAQDDFTKAEGYFYQGVAYHLWGDSILVTVDEAAARGFYSKALARYDSTVAYKHDVLEAWSNRGAALDNLGRHKEAIRSYDTALSHNPALPVVWCNRALAFNQLGEWKEEIACYDSALKYKHDYPFAWFKRGNAYYYLNFYGEALASYDSSLVYKRDDPETWLNRGNALGHLSRCEDALSSYDSALAYQHDFANAWSDRGIALACLHQYEEALASCDSALKYDPELKQAQKLRNTFLEKINK